MKIILTLAHENEEERVEARLYAALLTRLVERRQWQHFPGAILERGDVSIWVSAVELVEDAS